MQLVHPKHHLEPTCSNPREKAREEEKDDGNHDRRYPNQGGIFPQGVLIEKCAEVRLGSLEVIARGSQFAEGGRKLGRARATAGTLCQHNSGPSNSLPYLLRVRENIGDRYISKFTETSERGRPR